MSEIEKISVPGKQISPVNLEDALKQEEYKKGKKILMKNGSVRIVYSVEEEIEARKEDREYNA